MLQFKGIQKTTLVDYPGEVACTLFLGGCNFRCFYCFNPDLAQNCDTGIHLREDEVLRFLRERKDFLDGVCISGGEPMLYGDDLGVFLPKVKAQGYKIKIDTNGSFPDELSKLIQKNLVDYLAMDIKAPLEKYDEVAQVDVNRDKVVESIKILQNSKVEYEFRTTVYSRLQKEDLERIGSLIKGSRRYFLQPARLNLPVLDNKIASAYPPIRAEDLIPMAENLKEWIEDVRIRG